jgi:hypothetical protein
MFCCAVITSRVFTTPGDQAAITFTLRGTPPFTFTYQRAELGKPNQVVESHTVSGVMDHEYTIHSALEGSFNSRRCAARADWSS